MATKKEEITAPRCEGWRRYGGALTFGLPRWEQCKENGIVMLTVVQDGETQTLPACKECWQEVIDNKITITAAQPL